MHHVSDNGKLFLVLDKAKKQRPKSSQGIIRCRPKNSEAMAMRSGAHGGLIAPLERGSGGITLTRTSSVFRAAASQHSEEFRPKCYQGIIRCRAGAGGQGRPRGDGKPVGLMCPLEMGVRGIETSGSGYLRQQIRKGRKGRAERQGLAHQHNTAKKSDRSANRASADAGPELAGRKPSRRWKARRP